MALLFYCFFILGQPSYVNAARRLRAAIILCNTNACTRLSHSLARCRSIAPNMNNNKKRIPRPHCSFAYRVTQSRHARGRARGGPKERLDGHVDPALRLGWALSQASPKRTEKVVGPLVHSLLFYPSPRLETRDVKTSAADSTTVSQLASLYYCMCRPKIITNGV